MSLRPMVQRSDGHPPSLATGGRSPRRVARTLVAAAVAVAALGVFAAPASAADTLVTVTLTGSEPGRVVSVQHGIDCSNIPGEEKTDCTFGFPTVNARLRFVASGGPGAALLSWGGDAGGTCMGGKPVCETRLLNMGAPVISLEARFGPTPEPPSVATSDVSDVQFPSARVSGEVNPNSNAFSLTACRFEYGPTASYGKWAPCKPNVTTGVNMTPVAATIGPLEPNTTYHYRLKATSAGGTVVGDDATFTTGPAPADNCPNAVVRAQQGALGMALPDCMAYELVAPAFTAGGKNYAQLDEGEDLVSLLSLGGYGGVLNIGAVGAFYKTERTATGWETTAIAPPAKDFPSAQEQLDKSSDQRRYLSFENLKVDEGTDRKTPIIREEDGTFEVAGPTIDMTATSVAVTGIMGTSANLATVVTRSGYRPAQLTDGTTDTRGSNRGSLLASTRDANGNLQIRQVAYRAGATMSPTCNADLGGTSTARASVSADGSKIFFTINGTLSSCKTPAIQRVWAKVGAADPIDLSASRCDDGNCGAAAIALFAGAARDGSRVYFTTQQKLVNGDQDTADKTDLYEYDFNAAGEKLRPVTASVAPEGAGVLGVARISDDGSRVYFVANGRPLAGPNARGVAPQTGDSNLYVYHREAGDAEGTTTFVGQLDSGELIGGVASRPVKASSGSGRFLIFLSAADLTGEKQAGDSFDDLYRYDSRNDELRRIWSNDPARNGASRIAGVNSMGITESMGAQAGGFQINWHGSSRQISDDGATIAFSTREPLSPWDANAQQDVYLWRANTGRLTMLTDGYADAPTGSNTDGANTLTGMSRSGNSIFLTSYRPLLAAASSGQITAFVVRVNGGFSDVPKPPVCVGDSCQGPGTVSPGSPEIGTGKDAGSGNVPAVDRGEVSVVRPKAVHGTGVVLRVKAPGKGRLKLSGSAVRGSSKTVARAGSYRIAVRLTPRAAQRLRKSGRLGVKVQVAFQPATGRSSSQAVSVTFKTQKAGKKGGR